MIGHPEYFNGMDPADAGVFSGSFVKAQSFSAAFIALRIGTKT